jgi:putative ABC transport system permease protein
MLLRLFRKIYRNKWLFFSMLIGVVLALAIISAVPLYTRGIMQKVMSKQFEDFEESKKQSAGIYYVEYIPQITDYLVLKASHASIEESLNSGMLKEMNIPIISKKNITTLNNLEILSTDGEGSETIKNGVKLGEVSDIEKHITIKNGRIFSSSRTSDGCYEVIIPHNQMDNLKVRLNKTYKVMSEKKYFLVRIVGTYDVKEDDSYWTKGNWDPYEPIMIVNEKLFLDDLLKTLSIPYTISQWEIAYDYKKITTENYKHILSVLENHGQILHTKHGVAPKMNIFDSFQEFEKKSKELSIVLWVLQTPVLLMILFYIFMVSQLIVEQEKNEISVLRSRGAANSQIITTYFLEGIVISIIALILGPLLGLFLIKVIGSANGFLQFVTRSPLKVNLSIKEYKYASIGIFVFMITMLSPVVLACRENIVMRKQQKTKRKSVPFWKRLYLDFVLLGIVLYGYRVFKTREKILQVTGANASEIPVDPLMYLLTTLFILGLGMLILRIYPYILKLIINLGKKYWSPEIYMAFINTARDNGKNGFIMLFLILTIAVGIFNVKSARIFNSYVERKINYTVGADSRLITLWQKNDEKLKNDINYEETAESKNSGFYIEPSFSNYSSLPGVEKATKVYFSNNTQLECFTGNLVGFKLMGIIPQEFGEVAWFDERLLPFHWYDYLNMMSENSSAVYVSTSLKERLDIMEGDSIKLKWGNGLYVNFVVYGFIDYWPAYIPNGGALIVANLNYMNANMPIAPYEVWIKKGADSTEKLYKAIADKKLPVTEIKDRSQEIIKFKNDPMIQGNNGALTLAFISSMVIAALGFSIYWILSIKSRILQFGILQALGMSLKKVVIMLLGEQILITGTAIGMGILVGNVNSKAFMPLMKIITDTKDQFLPPPIISFDNDYMKMALLFGTIILGIIVLLGIYISHIKMDQAIKLGED